MQTFMAKQACEHEKIPFGDFRGYQPLKGPMPEQKGKSRRQNLHLDSLLTHSCLEGGLVTRVASPGRIFT
jgi:hypothetical protein